jgi:hypothetical protein
MLACVADTRIGGSDNGSCGSGGNDWGDVGQLGRRFSDGAVGFTGSKGATCHVSRRCLGTHSQLCFRLHRRVCANRAHMVLEVEDKG